MTLRRATLADADLITTHRHIMFADNDFQPPPDFATMNAHFATWIRKHLADETYIGLFLEDDETHNVVAGAGIYLLDWPPHFMDPASPVRAYLLNFYTAPKARGRGLATQLLDACVKECLARNIGVITLHASKFGRPIYEKYGFTANNEMILRPEPK